MSRENVEVVRRTVEARSTGDIEAILTHADEDVEIHSLFSVSTEGEPYRGSTGVRQWIEDASTSFETFRLQADEFRDLGDRVLALGRVHWRGPRSGATHEEPFAWVCEFRDGRLSRLVAYPDWRSALEAEGTRE